MQRIQQVIVEIQRIRSSIYAKIGEENFFSYFIVDMINYMNILYNYEKI